MRDTTVTEAEWPIICHRCGVRLTPGRGDVWVVKIEAFADPTPPLVNPGEPLEAITPEIEDLLEQMKDLSAQELMDQVHRRLTVLLCAACYRSWIENPTS